MCLTTSKRKVIDNLSLMTNWQLLLPYTERHLLALHCCHCQFWSPWSNNETTLSWGLFKTWRCGALYLWLQLTLTLCINLPLLRGKMTNLHFFSKVFLRNLHISSIFSLIQWNLDYPSPDLPSFSFNRQANALVSPSPRHSYSDKFHFREPRGHGVHVCASVFL